MIDHVSIPVSDLERAAAFYEKVLAPLGYARLVEREATIGFGKSYPEFWLNLRAEVTVSDGAHVALRTRGTELVQAFYDLALENGGTCDGPPGPREATNPGYYAAFIVDLDGNRVEAVTFVAAD
ncbi:MAG: VOC family protein [Hyphomicrobiaceae bacterium]|nr:VOC family protein [Hyphomicrobiaceae bacterium]